MSHSKVASVIRSLFDVLLARRPKVVEGRPPNRFRFAAEQLEAREVPAAFTVNSGADLNDSNLGDGIAWTGNMILNPITARMQQEVTLRAAIQEANALGAQGHTIGFLPALMGGPSAVVLTHPMDDILVPVTIDGNDKDQLAITRDTGQAGFEYFRVVQDIEVAFKNMTIRDAVAPNMTNGGDKQLGDPHTHKRCLAG